MKTQGFTLIELMVVVAIIGVLASIALPSYHVYIVRSQVAESMTMVGQLKMAADDYYKHSGQFPASNQTAAIPAPELLIGNYVESVELADGAFHVLFGNKVNAQVAGKTLTIRPIVVSGSPASPHSWVCGNSGIPEGMEAVGENRTDVGREFLPPACQGSY